MKRIMSLSSMKAASGVRSILPTLGIMRRKGARIGSVNLCIMITSILVGSGENQDKMTLKRAARMSNSHRRLRKLNKIDMANHYPVS